MRPHRRQPTRLPHPWDSAGKNTGVGCHFLLQCMKVKSESEVARSCLTLSDPMDCSPPGSSVHGIFRARVLEWGAIAFSESCTQISFFFFKLYIIVLVLPNQISFKKNSSGGQDGGGVGRRGVHLSPQIHQEYTFLRYFIIFSHFLNDN